jgi:hypothetical protein
MVGIVFNVVVAVFAVATVRLRQATGEVLPQHDFSGSLRRMTNLARNAAKSPATSAARRRAKRARERTRATTAPRAGQNTGEFRRADIHTTQLPDREPETTLK